MTASQKPLELKIQLFNGFAAWRDGTPLRYEQSVQEHKLLVCLLLHKGKPVSRGWLASVLWPDSDEANAKRNLRAVLSRLRDTLGLALPAVKEHDAKSLLFDSALLSTSVEVDVYDFEAAYGAGRWRQAVEAYQGTLLKGWYEDWFLGQEREYHDKYGLALTKAAENAAEAGRLQDALYYASRGLEDEHLLQEDFLDMKMRLLAEFGHPADLETAFSDYQQRLKQDRYEVSPETQGLYKKYLLQSHRNARQKGTGYSPKNRGYLWEAPAPILGRERETQEVAELLKRGRLVTLTGAGGVGKTRLARHVLERLHANYPDSALFLELSEVTEPALLWSHLAKAFGLPDSPRVAEESVLRYLRPRELLLALDNCEPILQAVSKMTHTILTRCPNVRIVATSRVALGVLAERQYPVLPLPLPEVDLPDLETLAKVDSIALFVERASAVQSDFAFTSQTASAIVDLCRFTGGMPLFLEVLAKRSKYRSVVEMSADIAKGRWREFGSGASQTLNAYHEYVRSCVLPEHVPIVALLAAFPTGFDERMAEFAIRYCSASPLSALELIAELDRKGLLFIAHSSARKRFRFPEPIRLFLQPSANEESAVVHERLIGWGHDFLARREGWFDCSKRVEWFRDIEREFGNLCATLSLQAVDETTIRKALAIAENLFPYWWRRGLHTLGRDYLQRTIQQADGMPDCIELGRALIGSVTLVG